MGQSASLITSMFGYSAEAVEPRSISGVHPGEQILMPRGVGIVLRIDHFAPGTHFLAPLPQHWEAHRIVTTAGEHWTGPGSLVSVYHPEKDLVGAQA